MKSWTVINNNQLFFRDALRERVEDDVEPPVRPKRTRSLRKRKDESMESYDATPPPDRPKRERSSLRRSQESFTAQASLDRANSLSTHRIVYQMESQMTQYQRDELASETLDDIVVVKPARRKSKSSLRSQSQSRLPPEEQNIVLAPLPSAHPEPQPAVLPSVPPVPCRRKRLRRDQSSSLR